MSSGTEYDIKNILLEMREDYWTTLADAEETEAATMEYVTFRLGGETYAIATTAAAEVIRIPKLIRIPRVQTGIMGVFNLRGVITAALDIRPVLELQAPQLSASARIIIMKGEHAQSGIVVEAVEGVEALPDTAEPVVKTLSATQKDFITGQITVGERLVLLLDIGKLLTAPALMVDHG